LQHPREPVKDSPVERSDISYVWSGDVALAYRVTGSGPIDLLHLPGFTSNVELDWDSRYQARFLRRLASFSRLIMVDRRGWGCSDRLSPGAFPPLEVLAEDVDLVLNAVGSKQTAIFASGDNGFLAMLFTASHPDRVSSLVLYNAAPSFLRRDDMPWLPGREELERQRDFNRGWGTREFARACFELATRSATGDDREFEWYVRWIRHSCTPGSTVAEVERYLETDLRDVLASIRVPTLILSRSKAPGTSPETDRYLASRIQDAKLVDLSGVDLAHWYGDSDGFADEIEEFVTGVRRTPDHNRVLATVLFTDIASSTEKAVQLGDQRWAELLESHHDAVRRELDRYRGREIDTAGDGFLATFDGPARAVRCALAIRKSVRDVGLEIRAGLHTGEVELAGNDVRGIAVHMAARVVAAARPSDVLVSRTVKDLVAGSGIVFEDRGEHKLKGVPGEWRLYAVAPG
jgi:class 3 adenylate cyclase